MEMQNRIQNYWEREASRYSEEIWKEMNSFKKIAWSDLIEHYRNQETSEEFGLPLLSEEAVTNQTFQ